MLGGKFTNRKQGEKKKRKKETDITSYNNPQHLVPAERKERIWKMWTVQISPQGKVVSYQYPGNSH
jgi:hypothetical protein